MSDIVERETSQSGIQTLLLSVLAGLALIVACVGIYGVMANMVAQRTQKIGIRMALGARRGEILGLVLQRGMWLAAIGVAIGLSCAIPAARLMRSLPFSSEPG